jgi:2-aminoadipate transaminase
MGFPKEADPALHTPISLSEHSDIQGQLPFEFADRTKRMDSSAIREILKLTELPGVISFAGGLPAPESFPTELLPMLEQEARSRYGDNKMLQYGTTEGFMPLREAAVGMLQGRGVQVDSPDDIRITSGSQQALDLLGKILINPGGRVIVESPTYLGALQAFNPYGPEYVEVETDQEGMIPESLEDALHADGVCMVYSVPDFSNPTGISLFLERRIRIAQILQEQSLKKGKIIPFIEDDPYGQLRYEGQRIPPVRSFAPPNVIYLTTLSKTLAPGFRIGMVVARPNILNMLVKAKQGADLFTSNSLQAKAAVYIGDGFLEKHIPEIIDLYRPRRDAMLEALEEHFPQPQFSWSKPKGGLFIWVTGPDGMVMEDVLKQAAEEKVAFVPGSPFFASRKGHNTMRLNFSFQPEEKIDKGIEILGRIVKENLP